MSKIALVTGVLGQVGSHMADLLLEKDYKVIGLKRRSASGSNWRIGPALRNSRFELIEGDITDKGCILNILDNYKPDEIYNFAAQSHVGTSYIQPDYTFNVNTNGVLNILESMKFLKSKARLYQSSTSEMFGDNCDTLIENYHELMGPKDIKPIYKKCQNENTKFNPQSPYAVSKLASHNLIRIYREAYGLWCIGGIMFNTEGPRRNIGFVTRKITSYFKNLKRTTDKKLKLGNISTYRDWSYAPEAVEAIYLMLQNSSPKEYVIGTGETHSIKEFLDEVWNWNYQNNWCYSLPVEHFVEIDENCKRPSEVPYLCSDPSLIGKDLGWRAKTKFKELAQIMCEAECGQN